MNRSTYLCDACGKKARNDKYYSPSCPHGCGVMRRVDVPKIYRTREEYYRALDFRNHAWRYREILREQQGIDLLKRLRK
jgi:hypothetical protein